MHTHVPTPEAAAPTVLWSGYRPGRNVSLDTEENADCVKEFILENRIITICAVANILEISFG
jgi:hypothetical protein